MATSLLRSLWRGAAVALVTFALAGNASATTFKIATLSPDGSSWMKTMRAAAKNIEQQSDGRVKFKFYPGGVMGSDEAVMRKIRIGQLQGGAVPAGVMEKVYPPAQVYTLPLKFHSLAEVDYVRARMDEKLVAGFEEGGFVTFGLAEGGFAYVLSKYAISSVEELRSHKVRAPNNDASSQLVMDTFGINGIPLNLADVLAGLQTGLVDTVATSPIGAIALQWHTQVAYMNNVPIIYFYAVLALDKKVFYRLSDSDQALVRREMSAAFAAIDKQNREDNIAAHAALLQQGIQLVEVTSDQRGQWYQLAQEAEAGLVNKGILSREALQEVDGYLNEIRSQADSQPQP